MRLFAENLNFEKAIELRDRVDEMKKLLEARTR
jgi:excinuclease UvrABC helicase subunit UvrB